MKVVVDTNVLIAAFLTVGTSREVLDTALSRRIVYLSEYILEEFQRTLLSRKFNFPRPVVDAFEGYLRHYAFLGEEGDSSKISFSDPGDIKILSLCLSVEADFLITGDAAILALKKIGDARIILPAQFWKATLDKK